MNITGDVKYIGVNDKKIDLFEGIYKVPNGMSYNSYAIIDEKIAIMDTIDEGFFEEWLANIKKALKDRKPDYLVVQHMEPDHSANILNLVNEYPDITIVASQKAFEMMKNYFGVEIKQKTIAVSDETSLCLGKHTLIFATAPMVHWPEVIVTYDTRDKIIFSADAFGKFGAYDTQEEWISEARRYYFGIVGKYGIWVQKLLKKIKVWDIEKICPLHGPVLTENISYYIDLYNKWSSYEPEDKGIAIVYTSVYGNTKDAVMLLAEKLRKKGCSNVVTYNLIRDDMSKAVADAFRYDKLVLATTTYNAEIFPPMREFINCLTERFYCNRMVAFIENGSWAPIVAKLMREQLEKCKSLLFADISVKIISSLNEESTKRLELLADELSTKH